MCVRAHKHKNAHTHTHRMSSSAVTTSSAPSPFPLHHLPSPHHHHHCHHHHHLHPHPSHTPPHTQEIKWTRETSKEFQKTIGDFDEAEFRRLKCMPFAGRIIKKVTDCYKNQLHGGSLRELAHAKMMQMLVEELRGVEVKPLPITLTHSPTNLHPPLRKMQTLFIVSSSRC